VADRLAQSGSMPDNSKEIEISMAMSQAGGRAVALFMGDPSRNAGEDWEARLAATAYRAMQRIAEAEID
jgi:hypothetical protein